MPRYIEIWTDGSCKKNATGLPGGWSAVLIYPSENNPDKIEKLEKSGCIISTTINRMELIAVIRGIENALTLGFKNMNVYSDSMYVVKLCTRWMYSWKKKRWNIIKKTKANIDLAQQLYDLFTRQDLKINIEHVKGHSGLEYNEKADEIAKKQANVIKNASVVKKISPSKTKKTNFKKRKRKFKSERNRNFKSFNIKGV